MDTVKRYIARTFRIEEGEVEEVDYHKIRLDKNMNVCDVWLRDRKVYEYGQSPYEDPAGSTSYNLYYKKKDVPVLQSFIGSSFGFPWTPRRGDLVKVLFYQGEKAIILGPSINWEQPSVCRWHKYDVRWKWCQWQLPPQNPLTMDYGFRKTEPGFGEHPPGKKPFCFNIWHGEDTPIPGNGRDFALIWDYCQQGDKIPYCDFCHTIDYPKRTENQWLKVYSWNTLSKEARPKRWEFHASCGSYLRFESSSCGNSKEYSEGRGHIRMENAVSECDRRGHINFHPTGTIDMHWSRNKGPGECASDSQAQLECCMADAQSLVTDPPSCQSCVANACEKKGHRVRVISDLDPDEEAVEMIDLDTDTYVIIYKETSPVFPCQIHIVSQTNKSFIIVDGPSNKVSIYGTREIYMSATEKIVADTPLFIHTGDVEAKHCTHTGCTCPCCGV